MKTYQLSCKKNAVNKISSVKKTKESRLMLVSNCAVCGKKKTGFIKNQEASELFCKLRIRTPWSNIPLIGDILFWG